MEQTRSKLRTFLARHMGGRTLGDDELIFATGFVNSMFAMQLILFLEREFNLSVSNQDLEFKNFQTIDAIAVFVEGKTNSLQLPSH